jgi:hypothetical protein
MNKPSLFTLFAVEAVAVFFIIRLWRSKSGHSVAAKLGWSLVLLLPALGLMLYGLSFAGPTEEMLSNPDLGARPGASPKLPPGSTDDMNIALPPGISYEQIVNFVLQCYNADDPYPTALSELQKRFGVSADDAALAWDRVQGGVVRAMSRNPINRPQQDKDPMARLSYDKALADKRLASQVWSVAEGYRKAHLRSKGQSEPI